VDIYEVELTGTSKIEFNGITKDALGGLESGGRVPPKKDSASREAEALERLYLLPDGTIGATWWQVKAVLLDGVKSLGLKIGRKSAFQAVAASVVIQADGSFGCSQPDEIVQRVVRIPPRTGSLALKAWPCLYPGWRLRFRVGLLNPGRIDAGSVQRAFEEAGKFVGMGTGRPQNGRFNVTGWRLVEGDQ